MVLLLFSRMTRGQEKFVSIADLEGWGYSNSDIRGYLAVLSVLQVQHSPFSKHVSIIYYFTQANSTTFDLFTGLLPREAGKIIYSSCALHIHDCMEDYLPIC